ncbi:MAG: hypothetical protein JST31_16935 [Actinobacteria bacterium]|nr:hypothetical protein [Actinomycetota bacterium]
MRALARGVLALYPLAYRRRYGEEMEALLEDSEVRVSTVADLAKGAALAHLRPRPELRGAAVPAADRVRAAAVGVLACWLLFALAGLGFYKTTEDGGFHHAGEVHRLLGYAHLSVQLLAVVGSLAVLAAIVPFAAAALAGAGADRRLRGAALLAGGSVAALLLATAALVAFANVVGTASAGVSLLVLLAWATVALAAGAGCALAARRGLFALPIGRRGLVFLAALGGVVALTMAAIAVATAIYLVALASAAPGLGAESNGPLGLLSVTASLALQLGLMLVAVALAARAALHARAALTPASTP